ncbi:MAG TPA: sensor histidine kinase [Gemmatimonadaceae bacterium]|nr:sensor histidine kinase [Gemmatimonadaceae bacterium]
MSTLANFIRENTEEILSEWETFARSLPMGASMDIAALRDHAKEMLGVIASDLATPQTEEEQEDKAAGESDAIQENTATAAQAHGAGRAESGFSVAHMVAEFRALRASVIRLWTKHLRNAGADELEDMTRFNEAIDQAIAESIVRYTDSIGRSQELFLAILGHDLRTPLGAIITSSSFVLETHELRGPNLTLVTRIASSARRMNQMVSDLLEFTRSRFGSGIPIVRTDTDVTAVVQDVAAEIAASFPGSVVRIETGGDLRGQWDAGRLAQAVTNLACNAIQHGSKALIYVTAHGMPDEVVISVQNEGPVIPREQLGEIFQAMKPDKPEGGRDRHHLGLGLYIVDRIVAAHGGSVDVSSSEEQGTTFTIHLPRPG